MSAAVTLYSFKPRDASRDGAIDESHKMADPMTSFPEYSHPDSYPPPMNERREQTTPAVAGRECWDRKAEYLLALVGYTVDLGYIWRFPFLFFKNGGGAFVVPYVVMTGLLVAPIVYLELLLGQCHGMGPAKVWDTICPMFKGLGYGLCLIHILIAVWYNTYIAWALYYMVASWNTTPWTRCDNAWNTNYCVDTSLNSHPWFNLTYMSFRESKLKFAATEYFKNHMLNSSSNILDVGSIQMAPCVCLLFVFIILFFMLFFGVRSLGKVAYFTSTVPFLALVILCIRSVMLEGAVDGLKYTLPNWSKLAEMPVWIDATAEAFFSIGPGTGVLLTMASYNKVQNKCYWDTLLVVVVNFLTSVVAMVMVFSLLGYLSLMYNMKLENVIEYGPILAFGVLPQALGTLTVPSVWCAMFFLMLVSLGVSSSSGSLLVLTRVVCDEWPLSLVRRFRWILVAVLVLALYLTALPSVTNGGFHFVTFMTTHTTAYSVLLFCALGIIAVIWIYGVRRFTKDIHRVSGYKPSALWAVFWSLSPLFIIFLLAMAMMSYWETLGYLSSWVDIIGLVLVVSPLIIFLVYIVYKAITTKCTRDCIQVPPTIEERCHSSSDIIRSVTSF